MPVENLTHKEEFESWKDIEGTLEECDFCQTCRNYHPTTDYCLLGLFEKDESKTQF